MSEGIQQSLAGLMGVVMMFGLPWYLKTHHGSSSSSTNSTSSSPEISKEDYQRNFTRACAQNAPAAFCECGARYAVEHHSLDELVRIDQNPNGSEAASLLQAVKSHCP